MPGTTDNDLNTGGEPEDPPEGEPTDPPEGEPEGDANKPADKSDKRLRDLQSKADAETARANKAEAALKALNADKGTEPKDPVTKALMEELRETSLDAIYAELPQLKQYGIERSLIEGSTRAQMRENATAVVELIDSVSSKVRNEVLAEHGLSAEGLGGSRTKQPDYAAMDDDAFKKLLDSM